MCVRGGYWEKDLYFGQIICNLSELNTFPCETRYYLHLQLIVIIEIIFERAFHVEDAHINVTGISCKKEEGKGGRKEGQTRPV